MPQDSTLPEGLQAEIQQVEAEADALLGRCAQVGFVSPATGGLSDTGIPGLAPLSYIRELLAMLKDAWVEDYQDGPLRVHRDLNGMRAHIQATQAPPERVW